MSRVRNASNGHVNGDALVLNRRVVITGSFSYDGEVLLAGRIEGGVRCKSLQIAERGSVDGDIVAERVVVLGEVNGSIHANELVLKTACTVAGEIYHRHLVLEDGCFFEGQSRRDKNPLLLAPEIAWRASGSVMRD
jgi:cytoskeletal protein CcmA (bactofilin family)